MSQEERQDLTYSINWEVATWNYIVESNPTGINLSNAEERAPWLAGLVSLALSALEGFAQIDSIDVSTESKGEDAFNIKSGTIENLKLLDVFLRSTLDVSEVDAWLSLKCLRINTDGLPEEFLIPNSGRLSVDNNINKHGSLKQGLVRVYFNFESNIYSPIARSDNRALAALNAPRLRKFLHRLAEIPSLKLDYIDDPVGQIKEAKRYGVVDDYGYKMPDDPRAFEELLKRESVSW